MSVRLGRTHVAQQDAHRSEHLVVGEIDAKRHGLRATDDLLPAPTESAAENRSATLHIVAHRCRIFKRPVIGQHEIGLRSLGPRPNRLHLVAEAIELRFNAAGAEDDDRRIRLSLRQPRDEALEELRRVSEVLPRQVRGMSEIRDASFTVESRSCSEPERLLPVHALPERKRLLGEAQDGTRQAFRINRGDSLGQRQPRRFGPHRFRRRGKGCGCQHHQAGCNYRFHVNPPLNAKQEDHRSSRPFLLTC